jgi:acyl-coenzyme A thioesterase PaaI-like protein
MWINPEKCKRVAMMADSSASAGEPGYVLEVSHGTDLFSDCIGPYYFREGQMGLHNGQLHMAFRVQRKHLNALAVCHGGVIASFLDDLLGYTAYLQSAPDDVVTTDLATRFIGLVKLDDWVSGTAHILSASRTLVLVEGRLSVGDKLVAFASGAWRRLTPRGEMAKHMIRQG